MKHRLKTLVTAFALAGCMTDAERQAQEKERAAAEQAWQAEAERARKEEAAHTPAYYLDVRVQETHMTLDPFEHMSDSMNAVTFALPASYDRFKAVQEGQQLADVFRAGSFLRSGSLSDTELSVVRVPNVSTDADRGSCSVQLELKQSSFSLDISKHARNAMNAVTLDWDVPPNAYKEMKVGTDLIKDGFRVGSFIKSGSVGDWHLKVLSKGACKP